MFDQSVITPLQIDGWNRNMKVCSNDLPFKQAILRFHVSFPGSNSFLEFGDSAF